MIINSYIYIKRLLIKVVKRRAERTAESAELSMVAIEMLVELSITNPILSPLSLTTPPIHLLPWARLSVVPWKFMQTPPPPPLARGEAVTILSSALQFLTSLKKIPCFALLLTVFFSTVISFVIWSSLL
jgi:hypothetical protein